MIDHGYSGKAQSNLSFQIMLSDVLWPSSLRPPSRAAAFGGMYLGGVPTLSERNTRHATDSSHSIDIYFGSAFTRYKRPGFGYSDFVASFPRTSTTSAVPCTCLAVFIPHPLSPLLSLPPPASPMDYRSGGVTKWGRGDRFMVVELVFELSFYPLVYLWLTLLPPL